MKRDLRFFFFDIKRDLRFDKKFLAFPFKVKPRFGIGELFYIYSDGRAIRGFDRLPPTQKKKKFAEYEYDFHLLKL